MEGTTYVPALCIDSLEFVGDVAFVLLASARVFEASSGPLVREGGRRQGESHFSMLGIANGSVLANHLVMGAQRTSDTPAAYPWRSVEPHQGPS